MKVQCPKCKNTYQIDVSKIPPNGIHVKCPKCDAPIFLKGSSSPQRGSALQSKADKKLAKCGKCGEQISRNMNFCPSCGAQFKKRDGTKARATPKSTTGIMAYMYLVLNWIFSVFFLFLGLVTLGTSLSGGLSFIAIFLLLLPPVRKFLHSKTNIAIPTKARGASILILFIAALILYSVDLGEKEKEIATRQAKERIEQEAKKKQELIAYFNKNSSKILGEIRRTFQSGDFKKTLSLSEKYLPSQNEELKSLYNQAKFKLADIEKAERETKKRIEREAKTKEILAMLKNIPMSNFQENRDLYQQLVDYNPGVEEYKEKLNFYSAKIKEQQKEREERITRFGKPPTQSLWDGSYYEVERYLKRVANDPDSIEIDGCTEVYYTENGWLVGCDYRGRNAFGGMIRQSNWFTIVHGTVIKMQDASAYNP